MFQDINVAKSAPFALLTIYQKKKKKIPVSPQNIQNAPILANYTKFADHFSIWTTRNGNLKLHSKLREIHLIRQSHSERCEIHAIIANSYHSLLLKCTPTFYSKSRKIRPIR